MPATRTPQLDSYLKPEISQQGKAADKELAKVQTFVLDSLAPLSHLMELDVQGHEISHNEALSAARAAIELIGNAKAKISHLWLTKVIFQLKKSLLSLVEEDSHFGEVAPSLFGPDFARRSKEHVGQVKAMRSTGTTGNSKQQFFDLAPPTAGGDTTEGQGEEAPRTFRKEPTSNSRGPSGPSEQCTNMYLHPFNNKFQMYFLSYISGVWG